MLRDTGRAKSKLTERGWYLVEGGVSLATSESREGQVERKETPIAATTTVLYGVSREREREMQNQKNGSFEVMWSEEGDT